MPTTLQYRPILIDQLISNERINSYQSVFQPANDIELMGAYLWNAHVSGAIYPVIGRLRSPCATRSTGRSGHIWEISGGQARGFGTAPLSEVPCLRIRFRRYVTILPRRHGNSLPSNASDMESPAISRRITMV